MSTFQLTIDILYHIISHCTSYWLYSHPWVSTTQLPVTKLVQVNQPVHLAGGSYLLKGVSYPQILVPVLSMFTECDPIIPSTAGSTCVCTCVRVWLVAVTRRTTAAVSEAAPLTRLHSLECWWQHSTAEDAPDSDGSWTCKCHLVTDNQLHLNASYNVHKANPASTKPKLTLSK